MKKVLYTSLATALSISMLTGCNMGDNDGTDPEGVNYSPVRYEQNNGVNDTIYNDMDRGMYDTDLDFERDMRDIRRPNEVDTPFNMDEEEPDLDEEPSEQRREY